MITPVCLSSPPHEYREILRLIQVREWRAAEIACCRMNQRHPRFAPGWHTASRIALALKMPVEALVAVERAVALEPERASFAVQHAQILLTLGRRREALAAARLAERAANLDASAWNAIGTLRSFALDQAGALAAYERAVAMAPEDPQLLHNRAVVRRFLGDLEGVEADYDRVIERRPGDFEAYFNRSELRVQTRSRNHIAQLEKALSTACAEWRGEVQIRFALAKEYEDLGDYARSFEALIAGSKLRRAHLEYDVASDVATAQWIIDAFPVNPSCSAPSVAASDDPVFVVGLPRSGTTLVERILASHSALSSAGELGAFAGALAEAALWRSGNAQLSRRDLVALSAALDFAALGRDYLDRARATSGIAGRFIDKMPLNYLYCGLIRRALPHARIVHVTRHPMAVCHAMFKTLFNSGYPFSYDLGEIAQYYLAYRRLMQHWRAAFPDALYELRYERLVADQRGETRKLLEYCGVAWEDGCVAFHANPTPTTTASASQVRRPIYASSVSQWRHYETELRGLQDALMAGGIELQ